MTSETASMTLLTKVIGRVDGIEVENTRRDERVTSLERALKTLLAEPVQAEGHNHPTEEDDAVPAVDWQSVDDADLAEAELIGLAGYVEGLERLGVTIRPCWAWHPRVVVELLALAGLWGDAYGDEGDARKVGDYVDRYLPNALKRIRAEQDQCDGSTHDHQGGHYAADRAQMPAYARWWASGGTGLPPGLTERS